MKGVSTHTISTKKCLISHSRYLTSAQTSLSIVQRDICRKTLKFNCANVVSLITFPSSITPRSSFRLFLPEVGRNAEKPPQSTPRERSWTPWLLNSSREVNSRVRGGKQASSGCISAQRHRSGFSSPARAESEARETRRC
ncbi:hypothetical protein BaRGS_00023767 [Batillaria attramentaria]|uniref:Uncharacterized protein n=1 Tax=Batillaria attramentaria TaxID=370345 RepID=A0ABD0JB38_9CAEN